MISKCGAILALPNIARARICESSQQSSTTTTILLHTLHCAHLTLIMVGQAKSKAQKHREHVALKEKWMKRAVEAYSSQDNAETQGPDNAPPTDHRIDIDPFFISHL